MLDAEEIKKMTDANLFQELARKTRQRKKLEDHKRDLTRAVSGQLSEVNKELKLMTEEIVERGDHNALVNGEDKEIQKLKTSNKAKAGGSKKQEREADAEAAAP